MDNLHDESFSPISQEDTVFDTFSDLADDSLIPFEPSGNAHPPTFNDPPGELPLTAKEIQFLAMLDNTILNTIKQRFEDGGSFPLIKPNPDEDYLNLIIHQPTKPLTAREQYYNSAKLKRYMISDLFYNNVVETCMKTGGGVGKFNDESFAKAFAFQQQIDYLSLPIWADINTIESREDVNPFLLFEGGFTLPEL